MLDTQVKDEEDMTEVLRDEDPHVIANRIRNEEIAAGQRDVTIDITPSRFRPSKSNRHPNPIVTPPPDTKPGTKATAVQPGLLEGFAVFKDIRDPGHEDNTEEPNQLTMPLEVSSANNEEKPVLPDGVPVFYRVKKGPVVSPKTGQVKEVVLERSPAPDMNIRSGLAQVITPERRAELLDKLKGRS